MTCKQIVKAYPLLSEQMTKKRLEVILNHLETVLKEGIEGDIVELGCYSGTTSVFIRRLLDANNSTKNLHVYDSFNGLPPKSIKDASVAGSDFKAGELKASKRTLIKNFKKANLALPVIHKGWFDELEAKDLPEVICFAFLDGDFYGSIITSLELVWSRMVSGGEVIIDDYGKSNLPGVTRAVEDFFKQRQPIRIGHEHDLALIKKHLSRY